MGVAPVERFANAPEGHRPTDFLPGARSVVSMSIKISAGPLMAMIRGFATRELRHITFGYRWFSYGLTNLYYMDRAALLVARLLEENGHLAVPIAASGVGSSKNYLSQFSNRHAGVAAGIGELGWIGLCLTPQNGPRQRFVSVITNAELEPSPMYSGPKLCDLEKCRELGQGTPLCTRYCPMDAFTTEGYKEAVIGDKTYRYAKLNFRACASIHTHISDTDYPRKPGEETSTIPLEKMEPKYEIERLVYRRGHGCGGCMFVCPVGLPQEVSKYVETDIKARFGHGS